MMMFNRLQRHFDSFICNRNTIFPQVPTMVLFAYCDVISWSIFLSISPQQQQNRLLIKTTKSTELRTSLSFSLSPSLSQSLSFSLSLLLSLSISLLLSLTPSLSQSLSFFLSLFVSLSISLTAVNLLLCSSRANTCYRCILRLI